MEGEGYTEPEPHTALYCTPGITPPSHAHTLPNLQAQNQRRLLLHLCLPSPLVLQRPKQLGAQRDLHSRRKQQRRARPGLQLRGQEQQLLQQEGGSLGPALQAVPGRMFEADLPGRPGGAIAG